MFSRAAVALALVFATNALGADRPTLEARWKNLKSRLSNESLYRLLWAVPKGGDIHNHHEYSIPMTFWLEGATARGYLTRIKVSNCPGESQPLQWLMLRQDSVAKLPVCVQSDFLPADKLTPDQQTQWLRALTLDGEESRDEFFERAVRRLGDLERDAQLMANGVLIAQQQLQAENAIYLETQLDPRGFSGMTPDQGAEAIRRRITQQDSQATGVAVRMQVSSLRFLPDAEDDVRDAVAFTHRNRDLWVGVNLVGREDDPAGRPSRFAPVFREMRTKYPNVPLSLHAGESASADSHVADTIALGARRIGHGTNAYLDTNAMTALRRGRHLIEVSLLSNLLLGYVPDLKSHPFPKYLRQGVPVCLNTDDRGVMGSNLTDEYFAAVALFDLTWAETVRIGRSSLQFSFAEPALKKALLARFAANVARFESAYLLPPDAEQRLAGVQPTPSAITPRVMKFRRKD